ncbi:MAG: hypothetical protein RRB13_16235 [bacterium]|nr:hypothetical protein [bacterium]
MIRSEAQAYEFLKDYLAGKTNLDNVKLDLTDWGTIQIDLKGKKFHQSMNPATMRAMLDLQSSIYRACCLSLHGSSDIRILSKEEKELFEIQVKVSKGSSILGVDFQPIAENLFKTIGASVDPNIAVLGIIATAVIWAGHSAYKKYLENKKEIRLKELDKETEVERLKASRFASEEETKRAKIIANLASKHAILEEIVEAGEDSHRALLHAGASAKTATIQGAELKENIAGELVKASRRKSEEVRLDGKYRILRVDSRQPADFKVRVMDTSTEEEFEAILQDDSLLSETRELIRDAEWGKKPVILSINAKSIEGEIRNAVIIDVAPAKQKKKDLS